MVSVVLLSKAMLATNALVHHIQDVATLQLVICESTSAGERASFRGRLTHRLSTIRDPEAWRRVVAHRLLTRKTRALELNALEEIFGAHRQLQQAPRIETIAHRDWSAAVPLLEQAQPDVIVVFGTSLLPESVFSQARIATLNIHTGLAPHYRGVCCTPFAILNDDIDNIGVTIHLVRAGIDNGEIVLQRRPPIAPEDNEVSLNLKTQRTGHDLIVEILRHLNTKESLHPVAQPPNVGTLFLRRSFTLRHRLLVRHLVEEGIIERYLDRRSHGRLREKRIIDSLG